MRLICAIFAVVLALLASGCAGYKLGPSNGLTAGARSVQVGFFENKTLEPRLIESVAQALRKRFQEDGTYRLNTSGDGDIIVTGVITKYERSGLTFLPGDVQTPRDFGIAMVASVTAVERATGKKLLDKKEVAGRTTVRVGSDLVSAERQALPLLTADLAYNIASLLVDGTW
ncbi:MAG TPA: LPS assembly lipoprotein LptE [Verrucomicrobiae bacterium]|nr:LPS assembly lipoprotein LptE [Verrucomicrobiae bacterium]